MSGFRPQDPAPFGTLDAYREDIAGTAWSVGIYAEQIQRYCALGDDVGLDYSIRCLIASTRAAATVLAELKKMKAEQAKRQAAPARRDPVTQETEVRA